MAGKRYAVLVANGSFPDEPRLQDLRLPERDVEGLFQVLSSQERGQFAETAVLTNLSSFEVLRRVHEVVRLAEQGDLVLVYYSGHGKPNTAGQLHLATADTDVGMLETTSIPVQSIKNLLEVCAASQTVLLLDCCYSGAVGKAFARGDADDELNRASGGRGTYVMTASTATQIALEKEGDEYGVFTKHVISGIRDGAADRDGDGLVSMDELYRYVRDNMRKEGAQEPMKWDLGVTDDLIIARSGRMPRQERRQRIQDALRDLAQQRVLPNRILTQGIEITDLASEQLTPVQRRLDALLDQLADEEVNVGDFIHAWYEQASAAGPIAAAPAAPPDSPPDAGVSEEPHLTDGPQQVIDEEERVTEEQEQEAAGTPDAAHATRQAGRYRRRYSLWRVGTLGVISLGLYFIYWSFASWKAMSTETRGREHYPVWHALAIAFVPIYNLFLLYDHFRTIRDMQTRSGVSSNINLGIVVAVPIAWYVMYAFDAVFFSFLPALSSLLLIALMVWGQANLNAYWEAASGGAARKSSRRR